MFRTDSKTRLIVLRSSSLIKADMCRDSTSLLCVNILAMIKVHSQGPDDLKLNYHVHLLNIILETALDLVRKWVVLCGSRYIITM